MKVFFDTSVLVAACLQSHPHFVQAHAALRRVIDKADQGFLCAHSLAEIYAVLTRLPLDPRIHPAEAMNMTLGNALEPFTIVPLISEDYENVIRAMAEKGWIGGKIYDALLLRCAGKCAVERIYTFNVQDFRKLAPEWQDVICAP